ncbi:unnamed protein product [Owenia fusiformis]|uniref:Uncharacterized protein n=1 Tax=Owenia fusiformis TaxID=6347 RepID=A0A8S4Q1V2_OWEFU|nr:unnamed protein product [Owenia fusiformis]
MKHTYPILILGLFLMRKSLSLNSTGINQFNRFLCAYKYCSGAHGPNDDGTCRLDVNVTRTFDKATDKKINKMRHIHTCCFAQLNNDNVIVGVGCYDSCQTMDPYLEAKPKCTQPAHLTSIGTIDVTIFCRKDNKPCDQLEEMHKGIHKCCTLISISDHSAVVCDGKCPMADDDETNGQLDEQ